MSMLCGAMLCGAMLCGAVLCQRHGICTAKQPITPEDAHDCMAPEACRRRLMLAFAVSGGELVCEGGAGGGGEARPPKLDRVKRTMSCRSAKLCKAAHVFVRFVQS